MRCLETDACTPLDDVVRSGTKEIVICLIDHGATAKYIAGAELLLITARERENAEMLALLLSHGYDVNEQGDKQKYEK